MKATRITEALILGSLLCLGLVVFSWQVSTTALQVKGMERTVTVKGLSEREVPANIAIWPIRFEEAGNDLTELYANIETKNQLIAGFLRENGISDDEISVSVPAIIDRQAQGYGNNLNIKFRYSGNSVVSVYSSSVQRVRDAMNQLVELGKQGVAISAQNYDARTEFLFTGLNELKPLMIEEATRNARQVAEKFARDSQSTLGKIKVARQGQFSISDRDSNTPYIKKVRVVATLEYYLSD